MLVRRLFLMALFVLMFLLSGCSQPQSLSAVDDNVSNKEMVAAPQNHSEPAASVSAFTIAETTAPTATEQINHLRGHIHETRQFGGTTIRIDMAEPLSFPLDAKQLRVNTAMVGTKIEAKSVLSSLRITSTPHRYQLLVKDNVLSYAPYAQDNLEQTISPMPVGEYPTSLTASEKAVYRMDINQFPPVWTIDSIPDLTAQSADVFLNNLKANTGLQFSAPSVLYRTPFSDGSMATSFFCPFEICSLPMQSNHGVHDNWRDSDGREWGFASEQGLRFIMTDDGKVYSIYINNMPVVTHQTNVQARLISWSDALTSLAAVVDFRAYALEASDIALVAARPCYMLYAVPGSHDEYDALLTYEMCFRFYDSKVAPQLQSFQGYRTFYVDAQNGKVYRQ